MDNPDWQDRILARLDMPNLVALSEKEDMEQLALEQIHIVHHLTFSKFTTEVPAFRDMMRETGCIITGSTALHFLLKRPRDWVPGHVDIITPKGQFSNVLNHILREGGARLTDTVTASDIGQDLDQQTGTSRLAKVQTDMAKFTVKESATLSPFHPIPFFWATHLMNALTSDACICAYPTLTLRKKTLVTNRQYSVLQHEIRRYIAIGFTVFEKARHAADVSETCADHILCSKRERMIGDRYTFIIPTAGIGLRDTVADLAEGRTTCWKLGGEHCRNKTCFMRAQRQVESSFWVYNTVVQT